VVVGVLGAAVVSVELAGVVGVELAGVPCRVVVVVGVLGAVVAVCSRAPRWSAWSVSSWPRGRRRGRCRVGRVRSALWWPAWSVSSWPGVFRWGRRRVGVCRGRRDSSLSPRIMPATRENGEQRQMGQRTNAGHSATFANTLPVVGVGMVGLLAVTAETAVSIECKRHTPVFLPGVRIQIARSGNVTEIT
jgi:hypothetical protein